MFKQPVSVLVVIHAPALQVLLLERADHPGYWQSVTGSRNENESLIQTAHREVLEETGLTVDNDALRDWDLRYEFEIFQEWRHRYAPGITHNTEHVFGLCLPEPLTVKVHSREHLGSAWLPCEQAAEKVFSWSNKAAILKLPEMFAA